MSIRKWLNRNIPQVDLPLSQGERMDRMVRTQEKLMVSQAQVEGMLDHFENRVERLSVDIKEVRQTQKKMTRDAEKREQSKPPEGLLEALGDKLPEKMPRSVSTPKSMFPKDLVVNMEGAKEQVRHGKTDNESIAAQSDPILEALRMRNLAVFAQPMVTLPQRRIFAYEMYTRIVSPKGGYLPAARYAKAAMAQGVMDEFDQTILSKVLAHVIDIENGFVGESEEKLFFINLSPSSLNNGNYLRMLLGFLREHKGMTNRLVFEMSQKDFENISGKASDMLKALKRAGYRFSMDHIERPQLNYKVLKDYGIEYLKFHAFYLMPVLKNKNGHERIRRMMKGLKSSGFSVVIDRMENEKQVRELLDFDIRFGQGYLFGMPEKAEHYNLLQENAA